jgi:hypothetical protein
VRRAGGGGGGGECVCTHQRQHTLSRSPFHKNTVKRSLFTGVVAAGVTTFSFSVRAVEIIMNNQPERLSALLSPLDYTCSSTGNR